MIYLFEDRFQRMERYLPQGIESEKFRCDCVIDCTIQALRATIETKFGDAKCVIIHNSYIFPGEGVTPEAIKNAFNAIGVPVVVFSGDFSANTLRPSNGICNADMRSVSLYDNLTAFVSKYTNEGVISIPYLVFGPDYLLNSLLRFQVITQDILIGYSDMDIIGSNESDDILDEVARIKEPELQSFRSRLIYILSESEPSCSRFKKEVQSIIESYQK